MKAEVFCARTLRRLRPQHQLRQLGDVGGDAPRLVAGEEVGGSAPAGLLLEVHVMHVYGGIDQIAAQRPQPR
jgi:hypothetical protein